MSVKRGEVVRVEWPYSDRTGSKVRPAVVVQADFLNGLIADTILVAISRTQRAAGTTEVVIDPAVDITAGLRYVSIASCNNLMTIDQRWIRQTIGFLSAPTMQRIEACLKTALGTP